MSTDVSTYARRTGSRMRAVREQRDMSLADVAAASQGRYKVGLVGSYERGTRQMTLCWLAGYAQWLGVSIRLLLPPEDGEADLLLAVTTRRQALLIVQEVRAKFGGAVAGEVAAVLTAAMQEEGLGGLDEDTEAA